MLATTLICPNCQSPLEQTQNAIRCENNHCFDRAKQGYFNLLLSNKKKSKQPGDSMDMVLARQTFLESNIYLPISNSLNGLCLAAMHKHSDTVPFHVLDVGCGEGYYTQKLAESLDSKKPENNAIQVIGLDISKDAVKTAAKRSKNITWLVASGSDIPVLPNSQHLITCLFTRLMPEGLAKAIHKEGRLLTVTTGKNHLIEMREILYPSVKDQVMIPDETLQSHFIQEDEHAITYQHRLDTPQKIQDLLAMTPHQWRAPSEGREALAKLNELNITIDVTITEFKLK